MEVREDLLRPSLADGESGVRGIHSSSTLFACAFFGGPFAAIALASLDAYALRRRSDVIPLLAAAILTIALAIAVWRPELLGIRALDRGDLPGRLVLRAFALFLFAALWWMHRDTYRAMRTAGMAAPSGIGPGIACILLGVATQAALARLLEP
jgi:hypothetical protein